MSLLSRRLRALLALLCLSPAVAVPPAWAAPQYAFRSYDQDQGLENLDALCMVQDHEGMIWICTSNGLYRFGGDRFERMDPMRTTRRTLANTAIVDPWGRLWIGTGDGIYLREGDSFTAIEIGTARLRIGYGQHLAVADRHTLAALDQDGRLWRIVQDTDSGHWRAAPWFDDDTLQQLPQLRSLTAVAADGTGGVWLGCDQRICQVRGDAVTVLGAERGLRAVPWSALHQSRDGRLWARGADYVAWTDAARERFDNAHIPGGTHLPTTRKLTPIVEDAQGRVIIVTPQGVARWDQGQWTRFEASDALPRSGLASMMMDDEGSLWLGSPGIGLRRWLGFGNWRYWTVAQGLADNDVWAILRDRRDRIWVASSSGLSILERDGFSIHSPAPPRGERAPRAVYALTMTPDGTVWAVDPDDEALLRYPPDGGQGLRAADVEGPLSLGVDVQGRLLIGTENGLFRVDEPQRDGLVQPQPIGGELPRVLKLLTDAQGSSWIITRDGLFRLDAQDRAQPMLDLHGRPLLDYHVGDFDADGTLWVGGEQTGLQRYQVDDGRLRALPPVPGWPQPITTINGIARDAQGRLWVPTDQGVVVRSADGGWQRYDRRQGLVWNDTNQDALFLDRDGSVWIGTSGGLAHYRPETTPVRPNYRVSLLSAHLGNHSLTEGARLPWMRGGLVVRLGSPNFVAEGGLQFRWRLDGLESEWNVGSSRELRYSALPAGRYRLEVAANDPFNPGASQLASLSFEMRPPWWQSWWSLLAYVLALLALVRLVIVMRERRLVARQRALESLVHERTLELEAEKRELLRAREALLQRATHDALTGLSNRAAILEALDHKIERAERYGTPLAVALLDLDHFKPINDRYGHQAGDQVLQEFGARLRTALPAHAEAGRYGGEEFLVLLEGVGAVQPSPPLEALHAALCAGDYALPQVRISVTLSMGVCWYGVGASTAEMLLHHADAALYEAKRERNRVRYATSTERPGASRVEKGKP